MAKQLVTDELWAVALPRKNKQVLYRWEGDGIRIGFQKVQVRRV